MDRFEDDNVYLLSEIGEGAVHKLKLASKGSSFKEDYADEVGRKFPLHTREEALISSAYFEKNASRVDPRIRGEVARKLESALAEYGEHPDEGLHKTASAHNIPLGYTDADGKYVEDEPTLHDLFHINSDNSASKIEGAFDSVSPRGKMRMFFLQKEAGRISPGGVAYTHGFGTDFRAGMISREPYVEDNADAMTRLETIEKNASATGSEETLNLLESFDRDYYLNYLYDKGILDPVQTVHGTRLEKMAMSPMKYVDVGSRRVDAEELRSALTQNKDSITSTFGEGLYESLNENPLTGFSALPDPHKEAISGMLF